MLQAEHSHGTNTSDPNETETGRLWPLEKRSQIRRKVNKKMQRRKPDVATHQNIRMSHQFSGQSIDYISANIKG